MYLYIWKNIVYLMNLHLTQTPNYLVSLLLSLFYLFPYPNVTLEYLIFSWPFLSSENHHQHLIVLNYSKKRQLYGSISGWSYNQHSLYHHHHQQLMKNYWKIQLDNPYSNITQKGILFYESEMKKNIMPACA